MCGRFVISSKNAFNLEYDISYNVCPSQLVPVKTQEKSQLMKWSYSPLWKQDMNLINCRSETMNEKPSFKDAKRCIIFNNGWYEWQTKDNKKIPYYHYSQTSYFAGLYNEIGCLILTRNSIDQINHIHHRQPVLLEEYEISPFLLGKDIFESKANNNINFYRVSTDVNNPKNNNSSLTNMYEL